MKRMERRDSHIHESRRRLHGSRREVVLVLGFALVVGLAGPPMASAAGKPIIAVFDITVQGRARLAKQLLVNLADYLATQITAGGRYQVVPRDQLAARLHKQKKRSYKKCFKQSCQIAIGRELAASKSLATKIMKIGKLCVISATVYDLRTSTSERAASARGKCSEEALLRSVDAVARNLSGESTLAPVKPDPSSRVQLRAMTQVSGVAVRWPPPCPARDPDACLALARKMKEQDQGLILALFAHARGESLGQWPVVRRANTFIRRLLRGYVPRQTQLETLLVASCHRRQGEACAAMAKIKSVEKDRTKESSFLRRACDLNNLAACTSLANRYRVKKDFPQGVTKAFSLYRRACARRYWPACTALAAAYRFGRGTPKDEGKALSLYRRACDSRYWRACQRLGFYYSYGKHKDYRKAASIYRRACDGGHPQSCSSLAFMYKVGQGVPLNPQKSIAIYTKACRAGLVFACRSAHMGGEAARILQKRCDSGDLYSCNNLANMYRRGFGLPKNVTKAAALYRRSCDLGNIVACRAIRDDRRVAMLLRRGCDGGSMYNCTRLGDAYRYGRGVPLNKSTAVSFYRRACDRNYIGGCNLLAEMYALGSGVRQNKVLARTIYLRSCKKGSRIACRKANVTTQLVADLRRRCQTGNMADCASLASKYRFGSGVRLDKRAAASLYSTACRGGHMKSCSTLGYLYQYGYGVPRNMTMSRYYYRKACAGGYRVACIAANACPVGTSRDRFGRCVRATSPRCAAGWTYDYRRRRCVKLGARRGFGR